MFNPAEDGEGRLGRGEVVGIESALQGWLRNYRENEGFDQLASTKRVVLPLAMWAEYAWFERITATAGIGSSTTITLFVVPNDERAWLESIVSNRITGDNLLRSINLIQGPGYRSSGNAAEIVALTAAGATVYWPDDAGRQTVNYIFGATPILLEPGASISLIPDGAGVASTNFLNYIMLRRTKLIRSSEPYPA